MQIKRVLLALLGIIIAVAVLYNYKSNLGFIEMVSDSAPFLVLDKDQGEYFPLQFRTINYSTKVYSSGSAQFSETSLIGLYHHLLARNKLLEKNNIWIVDLRLESHGFINGKPVTWYNDRNESNKNLSKQQVLSLENKLLKNINLNQPLTINELKKLSGGYVDKGTEKIIVPNKVQSESELVTAHGLNYYRFIVLDHHYPAADEVDEFIEFVKERKTADWLHFHCRGGKGRSSTFLSMYFIIRYHHLHTLDEILDIQLKSGNIDFDKRYIDESKSWKNSAATERQTFIKDFYTYMLDIGGYKKSSWSKWISRK